MTGVKRYAPAGVPIRLFSQPQLIYELAGPSGRVGMVMKSTPFFSKDIIASLRDLGSLP